jgi:predicted nucleic acid-binding protein
MIVLDASVVLKWIFENEEGSDRALRYRDMHVAGEQPIAVPDLFFYEVGNVLLTRTKLDPTAVSEAFGMLWSFDLEVCDLGFDEFSSAIRISRRYGITMYDAAYVELARRLRCDLVTADKRLYRKVRALKQVRLL